MIEITIGKREDCRLRRPGLTLAVRVSQDQPPTKWADLHTIRRGNERQPTYAEADVTISAVLNH